MKQIFCFDSSWSYLKTKTYKIPIENGKKKFTISWLNRRQYACAMSNTEHNLLTTNEDKKKVIFSSGSRHVRYCRFSNSCTFKMVIFLTFSANVWKSKRLTSIITHISSRFNWFFSHISPDIIFHIWHIQRIFHIKLVIDHLTFCKSQNCKNLEVDKHCHFFTHFIFVENIFLEIRHNSEKAKSEEKQSGFYWSQWNWFQMRFSIWKKILGKLIQTEWNF